MDKRIRDCAAGGAFIVAACMALNFTTSGTPLTAQPSHTVSDTLQPSFKHIESGVYRPATTKEPLHRLHIPGSPVPTSPAAPVNPYAKAAYDAFDLDSYQQTFADKCAKRHNVASKEASGWYKSVTSIWTKCGCVADRLGQRKAWKKEDYKLASIIYRPTGKIPGLTHYRRHDEVFVGRMRVAMKRIRDSCPR